MRHAEAQLSGRYQPYNPRCIWASKRQVSWIKRGLIRLSQRRENPDWIRLIKAVFFHFADDGWTAYAQGYAGAFNVAVVLVQGLNQGSALGLLPNRQGFIRRSLFTIFRIHEAQFKEKMFLVNKNFSV